LDAGQERLHHLGAPRLEAALRVGELGRHRGAQQEVVGAGDELPFGTAYDGRTAVQAAADGQVAVPGEERGHQRQERLQAGGEVDVHVADDVRVALAPDLAQRPAAPLLVQVHAAHLREVRGERAGDLPGPVDAGVVRDGDPESVREVLLEVAVQAP